MATKIVHDYSETIPCVVLYKKEIDEIIRLMRNSENQPPTISDDEIEIDSLEDLSAKRGKEIS